MSPGDIPDVQCMTSAMKHRYKTTEVGCACAKIAVHACESDAFQDIQSGEHQGVRASMLLMLMQNDGAT